MLIPHLKALLNKADQEIINFVMEFGKKYGYTFEKEYLTAMLTASKKGPLYFCVKKERSKNG